jgi:hypothetical protein
MDITISKKHTFFRMKLKLSLIKRSKIRPARASKDAKRRVIRLGSIQLFKRCRVLDHFAWCSFDERCGRNEGLVPEF